MSTPNHAMNNYLNTNCIDSIIAWIAGFKQQNH